MQVKVKSNHIKLNKNEKRDSVNVCTKKIHIQVMPNQLLGCKEVNYKG